MRNTTYHKKRNFEKSGPIIRPQVFCGRKQSLPLLKIIQILKSSSINATRKSGQLSSTYSHGKIFPSVSIWFVILVIYPFYFQSQSDVNKIKLKRVLSSYDSLVVYVLIERETLKPGQCWLPASSVYFTYLFLRLAA